MDNIGYLCLSEHQAQSGFFAREFKTELTEFCPWIGGDLQVFDANGDGYDDLTCHTPTGIIQISESHIVDQLSGGDSTQPDIGSDTLHQTTDRDTLHQTTDGYGELQTTEATGIKVITVHLLIKLLIKVELTSLWLKTDWIWRLQSFLVMLIDL